MDINPPRKKLISAGIATLFAAGVAIQSLGTIQARAYGYVQADCPNIVKQAIDTIGTQCAKTARGQLCYGNSTITAQFQPGANNVQFSAPGDTVAVSVLKQFTLGGMDTAANTWGVAELKIKADLPDADPSQAVTMILFGNVQLSDGSDDANATALAQTPGAVARQNQQATATANSVNQRATKSAATATKIAGLEATATARALISTPTGTIPASKSMQAAATATQLTAIENTATAAAIAPTSGPNTINGPYNGMQAFYFQSSDSAPCDQAPHDGILIQSPQASKKRVTLVIDGASVSLGSTVYITAQPGKFLTINTLEGSAFVNSAGQTQTANAGSVVMVPLDANLHASGVPTGPQFYATDAVRALPTTVLPNHALPFVAGLPQNVISGGWTLVDSVTSGSCYFGNPGTKTRTSGVNIVYNDTAMWYGSHLVLVKTAQGDYVGSITSPTSTDGVLNGGTATNIYSITVTNVTSMSGHVLENWSDGTVCTYSLNFTPGAPPTTSTLAPSATPSR